MLTNFNTNNLKYQIRSTKCLMQHKYIKYAPNINIIQNGKKNNEKYILFT